VCGLSRPAKPLDGVDVSQVWFDGKAEVEQPARLYFSPMGEEHAMDVHCIRKGDWKLRVAQNVGGEVYVNDRSTQAKQSAWLATSELYHLGLDPEESYDIAKLHPDKVAELKGELEALMPSFPAEVVEAYKALKERVGNPSTPAGAVPRPNPASDV